MPKKDLLKEYKQNVDKLKKSAKDLGLTDEEIIRVLKESFDELKRINTRSNAGNKIDTSWAQKCRRNIFKVFVTLIVFSVFIYVLLNVHTPSSSIVLRNVQGLTYPALKIVRILSVPIIKLFPSLTDLYDESCLIENPLFYVSDMECWPCENVHSVIDLTGIEESNTFRRIGEGTPFVAKSNQLPVSFKNLQDLYQNHQNALNLDSRRLKSNNANIQSIKDLFSMNENASSSETHIQWRINKMTAARIVRKLFPRPYFLPDRSGQSVERFLIIDGPNAQPYQLPNTECSYVFIIQGEGERTISLQPSPECSEKCGRISVILKPSYVLLYNWWYWRPVSLPMKNSTCLSISYINSYC